MTDNIVSINIYESGYMDVYTDDAVIPIRKNDVNYNWFSNTLNRALETIVDRSNESKDNE